jgi:transmembrane sensor
MSKKAPRPNQQILEEASTWFVTFRSAAGGPHAREDFHDWLKRSPEHIRAYLEIAAVYADIPAPEPGSSPADLIARAKSSPDSNVVALSTPPARRESPSQTTTSYALRAVAAMLMVAILVTGAWLYSERNTYETTVGEQRALTLPDGSIVELNARSKVRVAFHDQQRDVHLLEGQALFRVAKDHTRPFVVHAGDTSVRAVGTQFDVNRKSASTTVTVIEGRVAVLSNTLESGAASGQAVPELPGPASRVPETFLVAGEQIVVTATRASKAERPNIAAATAWTQHQLVFEGTPLSDVIEELNRYTDRRIVIDTPELRDLRISGQYTSTSPDSLLRFLSLQKGVIVTDVSGETHLRQE